MKEVVMSRKFILPALAAGAAFAASMSLSARVEARPLPVQGVESLAGDSNVTTVQARRGRVVRANRSVRVVRRGPYRTAYRYRSNRGSAIAAGLAVGAVGALAATAAAGSYYDPYYGSGYGYYPAGYGAWGYDSGYYGGGYGPAYYGGYAAPVAVGYYGGYARPYYRGARYGYGGRYAAPGYIRRNPARYGNAVQFGGYAQPYRGQAYYGRAYRGQVVGGGAYRNRGGAYYGGGYGRSSGGGWGGGLGPMGNMQSNGMSYAR
jgi:hypothetical protein